MASKELSADYEDPYKSARDTRGLIFSYAGPKQLQQARKEAIQIRIKERLNATLLKNKDLGYAGLETCDHSHDELSKSTAGVPAASLLPKPTNLEGSIEQFSSLVVPPVVSKRGEELASSARLVVDGRPSVFQHTPKVPHKFGNAKNVNTAYRVDGEEQGQAQGGGNGGAGTLTTKDQSGKAPPPRKPPGKHAPPKQARPAAQGKEPGAGVPILEGGGQEARAKAAGASAKAPAAASDGEGSGLKVAPKVDGKLLRTLNSSVAAAYVPVVIAPDIVPSRGLSTTAGVIGAVRKSVVDNNAIMRPLSAQAANTLETRMVRSGVHATNSKERMSYVGGADIPASLSAGAKLARTKAEEEARSSAPLVKVEEIDIVQESKRKATASMLRQHRGSMGRSASMQSGLALSHATSSASRAEPDQFEPVDPAALAASSQAAVAMLVQGLVPPASERAIPGFQGKQPPLPPSAGGGRQLSLEKWRAQTTKQKRDSGEGRAVEDDGAADAPQPQPQAQPQQQPQPQPQPQSHTQGPEPKPQPWQQQKQQKQPLVHSGMQPPLPPPASTPSQQPPPHPLGHSPGLQDLQASLPPQRPWPQQAANTQTCMNAHAHSPQVSPPHHSAAHQASLDNPPSWSPSSPHGTPHALQPHALQPPRPPWHLASAQLPTPRPRSSHTSPRSQRASPPRRLHSPSPTAASPWQGHANPTHPAPTHAPSPSTTTTDTGTSQQPAAVATSRSPVPAPAAPLPIQPQQHMWHAKRPASAAAARPAWRPSSPRPSSATACTALAHIGSGSACCDNDRPEPMYEWQLAGGPTHRHGTPIAYRARASLPGAAPSSIGWGSHATEPVSAALPWPAAGAASATSFGKQARPQSAPSLSGTQGGEAAAWQHMTGLQPPSSEARAAIVRQQQAVVPSPKAASRERDAVHALVRVTQPPLNSTPRYPFLHPPGAPSSVYPSPQPWSSSTDTNSAPLPTTAAAPSSPVPSSLPPAAYPAFHTSWQSWRSPGRTSQPGAASLRSTGGVPPLAGLVRQQGQQPEGQEEDGGRGGGAGGGWGAGRPHQPEGVGGGVIHGDPSAMQQLELPVRTEQSWAHAEGEQTRTRRRCMPYRSRPLSAGSTAAYADLRHNPHAQRPLSPSPLLALQRPAPPKGQAAADSTAAAVASMQTRSPFPRPPSGGPSSPALLQPSTAGLHACNSPEAPSASGSGASPVAAAGMGGAAAGGATRGRPKSAMVLSPSGVPSRRARPPSAGLWSRSS